MTRILQLFASNFEENIDGILFSPVHAKPEITDLVVILQIPLLQLLAGVYVKQVIDFHLGNLLILTLIHEWGYLFLDPGLRQFLPWGRSRTSPSPGRKQDCQ